MEGRDSKETNEENSQTFSALSPGNVQILLKMPKLSNLVPIKSLYVSVKSFPETSQELILSHLLIYSHLLISSFALVISFATFCLTFVLCLSANLSPTLYAKDT